MHAPLKTRPIETPEPGERRRGARVCGKASAVLVLAGRSVCVATVSDVSPYGCCVESAADWLVPGRFVGVALDGGEPLSCLVRWARGGLAGLELLQRLPPDRRDWLALID